MKERDRKLGRLMSTMSNNYPVLQVMGYRKMNRRTSFIETEPTSINIFQAAKSINSETVTEPKLIDPHPATNVMGESLNKFKWNKDYLAESNEINLCLENS